MEELGLTRDGLAGQSDVAGQLGGDLAARFGVFVVDPAQDLGADSMKVFGRVILPLSLGGVASGISMTFMPAVTTFVISKLLGGGQNALIGDLIEKQFKTTGNWGFGSAMSVIIMVLILLAMNFTSSYEKDREEGGQLL